MVGKSGLGVQGLSKYQNWHTRLSMAHHLIWGFANRPNKTVILFWWAESSERCGGEKGSEVGL